MANVVRMPGISADADSAVLVEWLITPGQQIRRGDVIATVETDKAVVDIEAEDDGVLLQTFCAAGETVAIGGAMAVLLGAGDQQADAPEILAELGLSHASAENSAPAPSPGTDADEGVRLQAAGPLDAADEDRSQDDLALGTVPPIGHTADEEASAAAPAGKASAGRTFATPLVRRLAAEAGVSLSALTGTGLNGRIRRRDLEAFQQSQPVSAPAPAPAPDTAPPAAPAPEAPRPAAAAPDEFSGWSDEPASKFRQAVARGLTASKQTVPHFYLKATCRVDALLDLRTQVNQARASTGAGKVTVNDFVVKAAAIALQRVPAMNVNWTGDAVRHFHTVDVGVAMASERGLVVPVLRSVDGLSLSGVSAGVKDFATRAAANSLQQREMEGGSLTVSNLGMFGVEEFTAIINPPQAAILAVGAAVPRAVAGAGDRAGDVVLARCVSVVLSVDHRPVDGALAAQWLQAFSQLLENPLDIIV